MKRNLLRSALVALVLALAGGVALRAAPADPIIVIVNKDNPNPVDKAFVVHVYTGAVKGWEDGSPVFALDQPEDSEARDLFAAQVLGKTRAQLKAIWSQNIFTGKGLPPRVVNLDGEMKRIVASNRHAIGYIRASQLDDSVRAVGR